MGICIKNNPQIIQQQRVQMDLTYNHRYISNFSAPKPKPQKITIQIINKKEPPQHPEDIDMSEPQPQKGLSEYFQQVNPQQDENEDEMNKQIEKLQTLRRLSSQGLRQSNNDQICGICYQKYQIFHKWPMQICINQHIICDQCLKDFQKLSPNEPFSCPFCRLLVFDYEVKPCKKIFKTLKKVYYKTQQNSQQIDFYIFAFQHELYEIASAYKQNRRKDIKRLQHLQFQNKLIEKFPYFCYFKNVLFLQLQNNKINDCLCLLPLSNTLKILNLSNNQITSLDWISQFNRLQVLACQNNKIRHITYYNNLLGLKELYLVGNLLDDKETIQTFKIVYFQNLKILSIESEGNQIDNYLRSQFDLRSNKSQSKNVQQNQNKKEIEQRQNIFDKNFSSLLVFIVTSREQTKKRQVKIIQRKSFLQSLQIFKLQQAVPARLYEYYFYGNLVQFIPDGKNSHNREYKFKDNKLLKLSSNFTAINSKYWIPHQGKQTLKMKIRQKNSNIMIGICTRSIKYSASFYSDEFIGITFWGNIYNKAESIPINCDLRISDGSIIAMILDFDKGEISWYIDKRLIGKLTNQLYFLKSKELYFIYGVRDSQIEVQFII